MSPPSLAALRRAICTLEDPRTPHSRPAASFARKYSVHFLIFGPQEPVGFTILPPDLSQELPRSQPEVSQKSASVSQMSASKCCILQGFCKMH